MVTAEAPPSTASSVPVMCPKLIGCKKNRGVGHVPYAGTLANRHKPVSYVHHSVNIFGTITLRETPPELRGVCRTHQQRI